MRMLALVLVVIAVVGGLGWHWLADIEALAYEPEDSISASSHSETRLAGHTGGDGQPSVQSIPFTERLVRDGSSNSASPEAAGEAKDRPRREAVMRWPVIDGELPVPAERTRLRFFRLNRKHSPRAQPIGFGQIEKGFVVAESLFRVFGEALAETPDGEFAHVVVSSRDDEIGPETSFQPGRHLEVRIKSESGKPLSGPWLSLSSEFGGMLRAPQISDHAGRVEWKGLWGSTVTVQLQSPQKLKKPRPPYDPSSISPEDAVLGVVDLKHGSEAIEFTLPDEGVVILEVTIDSMRKLPIPGWYPLHSYAISVDGGHIGMLESSLEKGELRIPIRPHRSDRSVDIGMKTGDYVDYRFPVQFLTPGERSGFQWFFQNAAGQALSRSASRTHIEGPTASCRLGIVRNSGGRNRSSSGSGASWARELRRDSPMHPMEAIACCMWPLESYRRL